jgi:nucleoid DNA-binding protein
MLGRKRATGRAVFVSIAHERAAMTTSELAARIANKVGQSQVNGQDVLEYTFAEIVEALITDGRVELRRVGIFQLKKRRARKARNPRTGEKVFVPEKVVVTFRPAKEMKDCVRQLTEVPRRP